MPSGKILASWFNELQNSLNDHNSSQSLPTITVDTKSTEDLLKASDISTFVNKLNTLKTNTYMRHALWDEYPITVPTQGSKIDASNESSLENIEYIVNDLKATNANNSISASNSKTTFTVNGKTCSQRFEVQSFSNTDNKTANFGFTISFNEDPYAAGNSKTCSQRFVGASDSISNSVSASFSQGDRVSPSNGKWAASNTRSGFSNRGSFTIGNNQSFSQTLETVFTQTASNSICSGVFSQTTNARTTNGTNGVFSQACSKTTNTTGTGGFNVFSQSFSQSDSKSGFLTQDDCKETFNPASNVFYATYGGCSQTFNSTVSFDVTTIPAGFNISFNDDPYPAGNTKTCSERFEVQSFSNTDNKTANFGFTLSFTDTGSRTSFSQSFETNIGNFSVRSDGGVITNSNII